MAKSAAESSAAAQKKLAKVQIEMDQVAAKLKTQEEALKATQEESAEHRSGAKRFAADMVQNKDFSKESMEKLKEKILQSRVIWTWLEDPEWMTLHPELRKSKSVSCGILYTASVWTEAEARYLLVEAGADPSIGKFEADVGEKVRNEHTGRKYRISVTENQQVNCWTNWTRGIQRIELWGDETKRLEQELQQQLREKAEELKQAQRTVVMWRWSMFLSS